MIAAPTTEVSHRMIGHGARLLGEAPGDWDAALAAAQRTPAPYTRALVGYQAQYARDASEDYVDWSVVLYHDGKPAGVWPISATRRDSKWTLGSQEGAIRAPLFATNLSERTQKKMAASCLSFATAAARALDAKSLAFTEALLGEPLGPWHRALVELGATIATRHGLYVDLTVDLPTIRARIRERYRSLVNRARSLWTVEIHEDAAPAPFEEFRLLHLAVAGRTTRSLATWELQRDALATRDAFLVVLRDSTSRMVGGGLFHVSATDGLYAVGAYDRSLFDAPVGHAVQWTAIETMKARGLSWYFIGVRSYPQDQPAPTPKELQIGNFKEGFATHVYPHLELQVDMPPAMTSAPPTSAAEE